MDEVSGSSAVIDRLEMDSVYVLRVRGCNKAGYGEYSEEVYLHTPPAPGMQNRVTFALMRDKENQILEKSKCLSFTEKHFLLGNFCFGTV